MMTRQTGWTGDRTWGRKGTMAKVAASHHVCSVTAMIDGTSPGIAAWCKSLSFWTLNSGRFQKQIQPRAKVRKYFYYYKTVYHARWWDLATSDMSGVESLSQHREGWYRVTRQRETPYLQRGFAPVRNGRSPSSLMGFFHHYKRALKFLRKL